jgi:hypothetical protein
MYDYGTPNERKAHMGTVSVKIPVSVLIEKLEARLSELDTEQEAAVDATLRWEKEYSDYQARAALALLDKVQKSIREGDYSDLSIGGWRETSVSMAMKLSEPAPERPSYRAPTVRQGRSDVRERDAIQQSLSVLRLTTQETVGASVYGSFSHLF